MPSGPIYLRWVPKGREKDVERPKTPSESRNMTDDVASSIRRCFVLKIFFSNETNKQDMVVLIVQFSFNRHFIFQTKFLAETETFLLCNISKISSLLLQGTF